MSQEVVISHGGDVDIVGIDVKILQNFVQQKAGLPKLKQEMRGLRGTRNIKSLSASIKKDINRKISALEEKIDDLEGSVSHGFYLAESAPMIEAYKKILKIPQKVNFMGGRAPENPEKKKIIEEYCHMAKKYANLKIDSSQTVKNKVVCESCGNTKHFEIVENNYVCHLCGTVQEIEVHSTSYSDIDRVNMSTKYSYDRRLHFRDCVYQYQGKQNVTIDKKIYAQLENLLEKHGLLARGPETPRKERFRKVTKFHTVTFLKEIDYDKYENTNLIHWKLTEQKPDDISHLEEKLMEDFTTLDKLYFSIYRDRYNVDRSSFINTQHIFYQLLLKYNHPCDKEEFSLLKTVERLVFHDTVCEDLFNIMQWNYTSFF